MKWDVYCPMCCYFTLTEVKPVERFTPHFFRLIALFDSVEDEEVISKIEAGTTTYYFYKCCECGYSVYDNRLKGTDQKCETQ